MVYHAPTSAMTYEELIRALYADGDRSKFEINGSDPHAGLVDNDAMTKSVVSKFKTAVDGVDKKFRKPLSLFMCQKMGRIIGELLPKSLRMASTNEPVVGANYKGSELLPFSPNDGELFNMALALTGTGSGIRYRLEVSEDKKSATVTIESDYNLKFTIDDAAADGRNICGNVKYSEQFKFDLTGDKLKMTSHLTSQHIEA